MADNEKCKKCGCKTFTVKVSPYWTWVSWKCTKCGYEREFER